jgi:hypothetical protein
MVFQALVDVLLGAIMTAEMYTKVAKEQEDKTIRQVYTLEEVERQSDEFDWSALDFTTAIGAAAAILAPILATSSENDDDKQTPYS